MWLLTAHITLSNMTSYFMYFSSILFDMQLTLNRTTAAQGLNQHKTKPANTRCLNNADTMLIHHLPLWANIDPALANYLVISVNWEVLVLALTLIGFTVRRNYVWDVYISPYISPSQRCRLVCDHGKQILDRGQPFAISRGGGGSIW